jgi:uncharacterized protein (TIGR02594 family)
MSEHLTITADALNVRDGAGTQHRVLVALPRGTRVQRLDAAEGWFRIRTDAGVVGWISAKYAAAATSPAATSPAATSPAAAAPTTGSTAAAPLRVTATSLNLRAGPGTQHPVLAQLLNGQVVSGLERSGDGGWTRVRTASGTEGWASAQYLAAHDGTDPDAPRDGDPKWYAIAWGERGVKEVVGPGSNPRIIEYQRAAKWSPDNDDIPWCSTFVNWVMREAGVPRTELANARSWLDWGVKLNAPRRGCVVVLKRGTSPTSGHVAFYVGDAGDRIRLLGGNQDNQVKISNYRKSDVLSYRWPA